MLKNIYKLYKILKNIFTLKIIVEFDKKIKLLCYQIHQLKFNFKRKENLKKILCEI